MVNQRRKTFPLDATETRMFDSFHDTRDNTLTVRLKFFRAREERDARTYSKTVDAHAPTHQLTFP